MTSSKLPKWIKTVNIKWIKTVNIVLLLWFGMHSVHAQQIRILDQGTDTSIRGLSVVNDRTAWVSGSNGWVGRSIDRGQTWTWAQVPGYEEVDFRDIEAFSDHEAVLLSAGSPLLILHTADGGQTWSLVHQDHRPEVFFDGMDFWSDGRRGIAFGDAIQGIMPLLITRDGGRSWEDISERAQLRIAEGEAGFAASGTSIRIIQERIYIGTGGSQSRLLFSDDQGITWYHQSTPLLQGSSSTGIFSIAFQNTLQGVAVGGDFQQDQNAERAVFLTQDGGKSWQAPQVGTRGYRSSVEYIAPNTLIACGTSGVDRSTDGGQTWSAIGIDSYHVTRRAKNGTWVLLAGAGGRIASLENENRGSSEKKKEQAERK